MFFGDTIKDDFFDVDFRDYPEYTFGDLGVAHFASDAPVFEDTVELIDESRWDGLIKEIDDRGGNIEQLIRRIFNQKQEGSCFPAGTLITLIDQSVKPIENIKIGETVITAEGRAGRVSNLFTKQATKLSRLYCEDSHIIHATDNHHIFTDNGYVAIGELSNKNRVHTKYGLRQVLGVESVPYNGLVHDFQVDNFTEDHSYRANDICVHNCVGNASTQANVIVQAKQFGKENAIDLSAISLYKQIGRSPNSGSMVSDAIDAMINVGVLPLDTPENRQLFGDHVMPPTGFYTQWPSSWKDTAKKFKAHEWTLVRSVKGMFTALFMGYPVVVGRQGHSICYVRPTKRNGDYCVIYANSWSEDWGFGLAGFKGGFGVDSFNQVKMSSSWAFALRSVVSR